MKIESYIEFCMIACRCEPLLWSDVVGQFAAEKVCEISSGQPREEVARQDAEAIRRSQLGDGVLHIRG